MAHITPTRKNFLQDVVGADSFQMFKKWLLRFMGEKIYQGLLFAKTLSLPQKIHALQIACVRKSVQGSIIVWAGSVLLLFSGYLLFVTIEDKSLVVPLV